MLELLRRFRHQWQHWCGTNTCEGIIDFDSDHNPKTYGVRCLTCGEEKWFGETPKDRTNVR
jgi:hypothetical protein